MMELNVNPESNIIYTLVTGTVVKEDMEKLLPILKDKIQKFGKARWYYEMKDFNGWKPDAFWEDVMFDLKHANDFEKVAMVGEKKWQEWMTQIMKPFTSAEIKYFDLEDKQAAKDWIHK